jgi:hypothetical protein
MSASSARSLVSQTSSTPDTAYDSLAFLLSHPNKSSSRKASSRNKPTSELIEENHRKLRYGILQEGIPEEVGEVVGVSRGPVLVSTSKAVVISRYPYAGTGARSLG